MGRVNNLSMTMKAARASVLTSAKVRIHRYYSPQVKRKLTSLFHLPVPAAQWHRIKLLVCSFFFKMNQDIWQFDKPSFLYMGNVWRIVTLDWCFLSMNIHTCTWPWTAINELSLIRKDQRHDGVEVGTSFLDSRTTHMLALFYVTTRT